MKPSAPLILAVSLAAAILPESPILAQHLPTSSEHPLKVGDKAPAFSLKSRDGKEVSLESLLEKGPVALVFYRSADW